MSLSWLCCMEVLKWLFGLCRVKANLSFARQAEF